MTSENTAADGPSKADILEEYNRWAVEPDPKPKGWLQRRGYGFEKILNKLLELEGLAPHANYRPDGEEIDGSIVVDFRVYLLEFKWQKNPMSASELFAFKGKIDGKLTGTLGVFFSQSGYSPMAIDALISGKGVSMILFDRPDLESILREEKTFIDAFREKIRYAAEYGQPYFPTSPKMASSGASSTGESIHLNEVGPAPLYASQIIHVVVEGTSDQGALAALIQRHRPSLSPSVKIWPAGGTQNLLPLADKIRASGADKITVLMDSDARPREDAERLIARSVSSGINVVEIEGIFIDILEGSCSVEFMNLIPPSSTEKIARISARNADLELVFKKSPAFRDWWLTLPKA